MFRMLAFQNTDGLIELGADDVVVITAPCVAGDLADGGVLRVLVVCEIRYGDNDDGCRTRNDSPNIETLVDIPGHICHITLIPAVDPFCEPVHFLMQDLGVGEAHGIESGCQERKTEALFGEEIHGR